MNTRSHLPILGDAVSGKIKTASNGIDIKQQVLRHYC